MKMVLATVAALAFVGVAACGGSEKPAELADQQQTRPEKPEPPSPPDPIPAPKPGPTDTGDPGPDKAPPVAPTPAK